MSDAEDNLQCRLDRGDRRTPVAPSRDASPKPAAPPWDTSRRWAHGLPLAAQPAVTDATTES